MRLVRWGRPEDMLGGIPALLPGLPMPTLLFHGMRDVLPAAFAERAALLISHSRVVKLDAGHFIPLDRPNEVAASLRSFFAESSATIPHPTQSRKLRELSTHVRTAVAEPLRLKEDRTLASV